MKTILVFFAFMLAGNIQAQNIGIGTASPNPSAVLDISSSTRGLLIPRLGTGQRTGIASPAKGLMVYDTATLSFWLYSGTAWDEVQNTSSNPWQKNGNNIYNNNTGFVGIGRNNPATTFEVFDTLRANIARFAGDDQMWLTLAEKSINRGYIGSYSGNPEDVDFGTYSSNATGKVHLTTGNLPRLTVAATGNVGINNTAPDASAVLDIASTSKGVVLPRVTTSQREAITDPATGLLVYDLNYKSLFMFDGFNWMALAPVNPVDLKLGPQSPADASSNDKFGYATGADSLYSIVGAPYQNGSVGAAYIYKKTNNVWSQMSKLVPDVALPQLFGKSVSIDFPYAVVGAPTYTSQGTVYVFYYNGTSWVQVNKFFKPTGVESAQFGNSVDIDNNFIVVGAPLANNIAAGGGAAYTYKLNAGVWSLHNTLTHASITANNSFGFAVAVSDSFIVIGSPLYDNGANIDEGRAYRFRLSSGGTWNYQQTFIPFNSIDHYNSNDGVYVDAPVIGTNWVFKKFGYSVDIKCNRTPNNIYQKVVTVIGAPESGFKFNAAQSSLNMGLGFVYIGEPSSTTDLREGVLYNKKVPDLKDSAELLGSSVSLSAYRGNLAAEDSHIDLQILCGSPGCNAGEGRILRYVFDKDIIISPSNGAGGITYLISWQRNYSTILKDSYSEKVANASTGFSCGMFDTNSYIVSMPGLSQYNGGIIFKF